MNFFSVFHAIRVMVMGTLILGVFVVLGLSVATPVNAAEGINQRINFQGRLLNHSGAAVADGYYNIQFKIYQDGDGQSAGNTTGSPAGSLKWTESWLNDNSQGVKIRNGYFSVELGSVNAFGNQVDWNQDTLWLSINVGDTNTSCTPFTNCSPDGEMLPMKRLSSTPYALNAGMLGGRTAAGFIQNTTSTQTANVNVQSANAADIAAVVQGAASQTADIFQVKADSVSTPLLAVSSAGAVNITPTSDATPALTINSTTDNILTAGATQIALNQDTVIGSGKSFTANGSGFDASGNLGIGTTTPGSQLEVATNTTNTASLPVQLTQSGTGDSGLTVSNQSSSYYIGIDSSDNSTFKINSNQAATSAGPVGNSTIGTNVDSNIAAAVSTTKFTPSGSGTISGVYVYVAATGSSPNDQGLAGIYNTSAGHPDQLIGSSSEQTLVANSWNYFPLTTPTSVSSGATYFFAYAANGGFAADNNPVYETGAPAGSSEFFNHAYDGTLPGTLSGGTSTAIKYSYYGILNSASSGDQFSNAIFSLDSDGKATLRNVSDTASAFVVQNAAGSSTFRVDTATSKAIAATFDATSGFSVNGTDGAATTCAAGEYLDGAVVQGGIVTGGTCTTAASAGGSFVTLQTGTPGTADVGSFNITGTGIADILQGTSHVYTPDLDTATAGTLTIGANNADTIVIGKTNGTGSLTLSSTDITLGVGNNDAGITMADQVVTDANGNELTIQGSRGNGIGDGGAITLQGGSGGASGGNGGNLYLTGGVGTGTGVNGLVVINTPTFQTSTSDANCFTGGALVAASCTISLSSVNGSAAVLVGFSTSGKTATLPDPTLTTAGRIVYITAANGSSDFTLSVNGGGVGNQIAMRQNTSATMIWNGTAWTAAGASSSTTLQTAYDNTLQSAGGAELVVSNSGNANGLTIRDSSVNPVGGRLLAVQNSSAADLISVNGNVTEYASDAGAEVEGGSSITFPANTWSGIGGATVDRHIVAGDYIATGQGSVAISTTATAGSGAKNQLTSALTAKMSYNVSFATRLDSSSNPLTDLEVYYSNDGSAAATACIDSKAVRTSVWTKINCTFTAPASGITASNAIFIRQTGASAAHDFYVDNLSVTIAADYNYATDGSVNDSANFATNWTSVSGSTVTRDTTTGNDASDSAKVVTTGAGQGVRNKLSINPLPDTLYRVTTYANLASGSFNNFTVRYSRDGGTSFVPCADYNTQTVATGSSFTKITCYIQTDASATTNPYVYFTQTDGTGRTFYVDTFSMSISTITTPNVQIGGGSNGGPTTLFTLDRGASAPIASDNDALLGSMYYDTTIGKLQCYEADGWGACGASPDNIITISPEYTNAVLHGPSGGATGIGTMNSDICSDALNINDGSSGQASICGTNETYNFYEWTSPQATAQTYAIYVTYQLPTTFKQFASGKTSIMGRTDNGPSSGSATVSYKIYRNTSSGLTQCGSSAVAVSTGTVSSWQTGVANGAQDPSACSFAAGDSVVFEIDVTAYQNSRAYVGNLNFTFSNS